MKKTNKAKIIKIYYFALLLIVLFQTVTTVYKLSQTIAYQDRITALQSKKQQLIKEQEQIELELARTNSLAQLKEQAQDEYIPITNVVIISADQPLALK